MNDDRELSRCPFCGSMAMEYCGESGRGIECYGCPAAFPDRVMSDISMQWLREAWNRRPTGEPDQRPERGSATTVSLLDEAYKERQQAIAQIQELQRERDEARDRCRALDAVETDLWTFACAVTRSEAPKGIRDKAAELVLKYDELNPPDLPWLNERPKVALGNPPDLFAPCYSPPGWIDPDTDLDAE